MSSEFRLFTDECLDGPSVDFIKVYDDFNPSCLVKSFEVVHKTAWTGKGFGDIAHIKFHEDPPSKTTLEKTSAFRDLSPSPRGYVPERGGKFLEYIFGFVKDKNAFIEKLKADFGTNFDMYFPKNLQAESVAPSITPTSNRM